MSKVTTLMQKTFQRKNESIPIWFMRQAGRYMPQYMEVRSQTTDFLELCYDLAKATAVTLQPIHRFNFDAAIVFSDILVLPHALGWEVKFQKGEGPILKKFSSAEDLKFLHKKFDKKINHVYDIVSKVRANLPRDKSLIGFAGAPWTVMSYMLEGKGKQDFSVSKSFLYNQPKLAIELADIITEKTVEHLLSQIAAGADIVQIFDSWSGVLSGDEYDNFVIKPTKKIIQTIKSQYPSVPIIGFPKGSGYLYEKYIAETAIDGVGVDQFIPVEIMQKWQSKITVQGNFDPVALLSNQEVIAQKAHNILAKMGKNFIFNLGHGILPTTPMENVEFLVNYVLSYRKRQVSH